MSIRLSFWIIRTFITLLGITLVAFFIMRLVPGDPITAWLGERGANPEQIALLKERLGLDKQLFAQYLKFVTRLVVGDFGESITTSRPVIEEFLDRLPATIELSCAALVFGSFFGILFGVFASLNKGSWLDHLVSQTSLMFYSMPIFWWGMLLILLFSVQLGWLPVTGRIDLSYDVPFHSGFYLFDVWQMESDSFEAFKSALRHLILPSLALGMIPLAVISRMTRAAMNEILNEKYILVKKAQGISTFKQIWLYSLRAALTPVITVMGLLLGGLLTGAVLTETIFSWPGIGRWLIKSVEARDYPVVQSALVLLSAIVYLVNLFVELLLRKVDPRRRVDS